MNKHVSDSIEERVNLLLPVAVKIDKERIGSGHQLHLLETGGLCQSSNERCLLTTLTHKYLIILSSSTFWAGDLILALVICKACLSLNKWSISFLISYKVRCFSS